LRLRDNDFHLKIEHLANDTSIFSKQKNNIEINLEQFGKELSKFQYELLNTNMHIGKVKGEI
jgi:hypothetical protein